MSSEELMARAVLFVDSKSHELELRNQELATKNDVAAPEVAFTNISLIQKVL